ncbi:MAG: 1-acyl-sn-glycerol-3-phosphate acyltransferase [Treponema sp.]|nr:1-acyl-sn-glycerol-3-phosphate acyltransferase [Treponema sp.]
MDNTLAGKYGSMIKEMAKKSRAAAKIDETSVYEEANLDIQKYMFTLLDDNLLPGSGLNAVENFKAFYDEVQNGKSGLILMEHYTNLDLPEIVYMLDKYGEDWSKDFSKKIVAVAGMKLNEADPAVRAFAECFTRVVIYPTRSLDAVGAKEISQEEKEEEEKRARKINFAAMRAMDACKKRGQVILVFPSGTRYRPGKPETKKGLREIDSYLRLFDKMILVSINGNCLRFNPECPENMIMDVVAQDKVTLTASPVIDCKDFRNKILESLPADEPDPKQKTVDAIMANLEKMHIENEGK